MKSEQEQENRFKAMFETVVDGIITIDDKGVIESFNPSAERLFGYKSSEVIGKNITLLMGEPHRQKHDGYIQHYIETAKPRVIGIGREVLGRKKDGSFFPFELAVSEMDVDGRRMFTGVVRDITAQQGNRQLLKAITTAQQEASRNIDSHIIFDKLLAELLELTQSEYGFIGQITYSTTSTPILKTYAITDISWNEETRRFYDENAPEGLTFDNTETLFGAVMTTCSPVISNDPENDPRSGGLPAGHPNLRAFLGIPFFSHEEFVGMVGIANRPGGYSEEIIDFLQPFLVTCSNLIIQMRIEKKRQDAEKTLRESEARGRAILQGATEAIVTINQQGIIEDANPATENIFGYRLDQMLGHNVKMLMPEPFQSNHDDYLSNYVNTGVKKIIGQGREVVGKRKNGEEFPMFLSVNHITVGGRNMFTGVIRDITEQRRNAQELSQLNVDLSTRVQELDTLNSVNAQLNSMNSYFQAAESREELYQVLTKFCSKMLPGVDGGYFSVDEGKILELCVTWGGDYKGQEYFKASDCWAMRQGEVKIKETNEKHLVCEHIKDVDTEFAICQPVSTRDGLVGLLSIYVQQNEDYNNRVLRDILSAVAERLATATSNLQLREKLKQESIIDPLTKLFNRRFFDESMALEVRRTKRTGIPLSILLFDIDYFKKFNDTFGHEAGDMVLQEFASILRENCRAEDIPCRYGGEEFAVVFLGMEKEGAQHKAEEIRNAVKKSQLQFEGKALPEITVSCGVASIPLDAEDLNSCMRKADKALYQAKEGGRDRVVLIN